MSKLLSRRLCLTTAIALTMASPALAQTETALDELVVTAQKREQNMQDVPISMSVVTGEQIADYHQTDLHDLMNSVPNVYVQRLNAADVVYIRGFGSAPANFAFDQSVSMYKDGIYAGRGKQFEAPFFDIERVEVLRGPQGALFGKNTPAGAISIVTAGPTRTFQGRVAGAYNFDLDGTEISGFVSGPLSETLSARLAVKFLDQDGWIHNVNTGYNDPRKKQRLARASLRYEPTDTVDVTAKLEYSDSQVRGANIVLAPPNAAGPITTVRYSDGNPFGYPEANKVRSTNGSVVANFAWRDHTVTSVTGYSHYDAERTNVYSTDVPALYSNRMPEEFRQVSQEVRLLSPVGQRLEYVVGAYVDRSTYDLGYYLAYNMLGGTLAGRQHSEFEQTAKTYSLFGQGTFNVTDDLRLIGSLRWTQTDKKGAYDTYLDAGRPQRAITSARGKLSEDYLDPSVTVQYDLTEAIMFYAVYGRGSKSGGFVSNSFGTVDSTFIFKPEKSTNYEAGIKSTLDDGRVVLNVSVYDTTFKDLQSSIYDPTISAFVTKNAAQASSRGVEAVFLWQPVTSLKITASGAYQDAKYDDFPGSTCLARQPVTACNPANPASIAANNIAGAPLTYSSKWTGNLQVAHKAALTEDLQLTSAVGLAYRSKYYNADNQSTVYGIQKGYTKVDARLALGHADSGWEVALVGKNLTDERTYNFSFLLPAPLTADPRVHKFLDEPRTILLEASLEF